MVLLEIQTSQHTKTSPWRNTLHFKSSSSFDWLKQEKKFLMCLYAQVLKFVLFFKKVPISSFDLSNLCFSTVVPQKLPPMQAKAGPSTSQSSRKRRLNSMCAVVTAHIAPLQSQILWDNHSSRCLTSHTPPTKDALWLTKHSTPEHSAPCTHDHHATVASAPLQNLDMGTWSGACRNSAWSQPAFKHCRQHHLVPGFVFGGFFGGFFLPPSPSPLGLYCFKLSE